jgi:hypothetical protein
MIQAFASVHLDSTATNVNFLTIGVTLIVQLNFFQSIKEQSNDLTIEHPFSIRIEGDQMNIDHEVQLIGLCQYSID